MFLDFGLLFFINFIHVLHEYCDIIKEWNMALCLPKQIFIWFWQFGMFWGLTTRFDSLVLIRWYIDFYYSLLRFYINKFHVTSIWTSLIYSITNLKLITFFVLIVVFVYIFFIYPLNQSDWFFSPSFNQSMFKNVVNKNNSHLFLRIKFC